MRILLSVVAILAVGAARAAPDPGPHDLCMLEAPCRLASDSELDGLRGGFDVNTAAGRLRFDIGITRAVAVNDRLVALSEVGEPGALAANARFLSQLAPRGSMGAPAPIVTRHDALVVQNGTGNTAPSVGAMSSAAMPLVVQNAIDNQNLKTFTVINATVNSLSVMRSLRVDDMLRRATAASGR